VSFGKAGGFDNDVYGGSDNSNFVNEIPNDDDLDNDDVDMDRGYRSSHPSTVSANRKEKIVRQSCFNGRVKTMSLFNI
jgi:hypothetical protein